MCACVFLCVRVQPPVFNKYFISGPKYTNIEWVKALYINWVGACVTLERTFWWGGYPWYPPFPLPDEF